MREFLTPLGSVWEPVRNAFLTHIGKRQERIPDTLRREEWVWISFPTVSKRQEWIRVSFLTVPKRQERIPVSSWGSVRNAFLTPPKQHRLRKSIDLACLPCELVLVKKRQPQARIV